jgi:hypothetical protein
MGSPYPWTYTLCWPWYALHPSTKRHASVAQTPASYSAPYARESESLRLLFFGDLMPSLRNRIPFIHPQFRNLIQRADVVIGNCEVPVGDKTRFRGIRYQMTATFVANFLHTFGNENKNFIFSTANNHAGDWGKAGFSRSLKYLAETGVLTIGHRATENDIVRSIVRKGLKLGLVAWTHWLNRGVFPPEQGTWRTKDIEDYPWQKLKRDLEINCLIGTPHWEYEFQHFPSPETRSLAQALAQNGFDILVGHHPHVVQPLEWFDNTLCLYRLGNLTPMPPPFHSWPLRLGAFAEIHVATDGPNRGQVVAYKLHPFMHSRDAVVPLEKAPQRLHERLTRRFRMLFPPTLPQENLQ